MDTLTESLYKGIKPKMKSEFSYKNHMEIPKVTKVSLNVGIKSVDSDSKFLNYIVDQISCISGQKAVLTQARNAVSTFKLREGMSIGCKVTLRGKVMYQFLDKLINIALPRVRDFRGLPNKGFNQSNHYSFGLKDHSIFLEVDLDNILKVFGMNVNIITTAKTEREASFLLKGLNLPIK